MIVVDWTSMGLGVLIGFATSAVFFAGLGFGMRLALQTARPVVLLVLSAVLRIAALLGIGWAIATFGGPFAIAGFVLAFFVTRTIATAIARMGVPAEGRS